MDGKRFDRMARSLAGATSRRRVLRGLAAGTVGALAGTLRLRGTGAQGCAGYGRVCTHTGCCTVGTCRCYRNGHCRCLCFEGTSFADGVCQTPGGCPVQVVSGPPAQALFTIQDTETGGLAELLITRSENADTVVPPFTVGTTEPVSVTSTKIDQTKPARIEIRVTSMQGVVRICDLTF